MFANIKGLFYIYVFVSQLDQFASKCQCHERVFLNMFTWLKEVYCIS